MKSTACTAPQSDVTKPLKPNLVAQDLRQRVLVAARKRAVQPVVRAHDRATRRAFTAASNGATYTSCSVWSSMYVLSCSES